MVREYNINSCVICRESITDPICKSCYIKQTIISLNDLMINRIIVDYIGNKLKNILSSETLNNTRCILCRRDTASICAYCFSVKLINLLRELNFNEELIENFEYNQIDDETKISEYLEMRNV